MSKKLTNDNTFVNDMYINVISDESQYVDHISDISNSDITILPENASQYVTPQDDEITLNSFPSETAFDSQVQNLTWSDFSIVYEDNDFVDKSSMYVYFYDYDGSVLYKYNIDEFFALNEMPPLPDHKDINKICDGWNWTLQEVRNYLELYPADIHIGCMVHCGNNPELGSSHVRFYDHEGNVLYDYTAAEIFALSSLPALPDLSSINFSADGWNWTLTQIKTYLKSVDGDVNVGYTMSPGNNPSVESSVVRFIDYEGTVLYTYTATQFLALNSLPALPDRTSENLTCDGWNWTFQQISDQINDVGGDVNVGAIYHTTDDKTHITCKPTETNPHAYINLTPTVANAVTIDWGDGNTDTWTSTDAETKSHTYTDVTNSNVYDIAISCSSGTYGFTTHMAGAELNPKGAYTDIKLSNKVTMLGGLSEYTSLEYITIPSSVAILRSWCFSGCSSLRSINIPNSVTILNMYCFYGCSSSQYITVPSGVTSFDNYCFSYCSLQSITIPNTATSLGNNCFFNCSSLKSIIVPNGVTSFGSASCFYGCSSLQSLTIPNGVRSIGNYCFQNCYSLQSITIPDSVTSFGNYCFQNCYSLKYVTVPSGVSTLGSSCFYKCYSLQSITIPDSVTSFGDNCFNECRSLKSITIPSGIASISSACFFNCYSLQSITIPNNVTSLNNNCFSSCYSLASIIIPSGVNSIVGGCFNSCRRLKFITIPKGVTSLDSRCLYNCSSLQSIAIPNSVTSIGTYCFYYCYFLQSITIPSGVTGFGFYCFYNCNKLLSITIPSTVASIGTNCFDNCTSLERIYIKPTTPPTLANRNALNNTSSNLTIYVPSGVLDTYKTTTNWSAFSSKIKGYNSLVKNTQLTNLEINKKLLFDNITSYNLINNNICVLDGTENNTNDINFYDYDGKLLYSYSNSEFLNLNNLPALPDRTGENLTCDGWNLTLSEIKNQINNVGGVVNVGSVYHTTDDKTHITFKRTGINSKAYIALKPTTYGGVIIDWGDGTKVTVYNTTSSTMTHTYTDVAGSGVYDIAISCTSGTYSFSSYIAGNITSNKNCEYTDIKLSNIVTGLGDNCFNGCSSLQSITIPNTVTSFGGNCFDGCSSLQSINIPNTVTSFGGNCFSNCYSLKSITIPNNVTSLGTYCFSDCHSLQSVTIMNGVTSLDSFCFNDCSSLRSITISNSVTSLGAYCFSNCSSLKSITIPNSVTSLGNYCFSDCRYLQSITIPNTVTSFGSHCFDGCSSLQSINIPNSVTSIGGFCFYNCYSLKSIIIPNGVSSLDGCFQNCCSLQSINIPSGVASFGNNGCFGGCYSLQSITIPSGVTNLNNYFFNKCYSLQSVTIPNSVTTLGYSCFGDCSSLRSITIPNRVTSLDSNCFSGCSSLVELYMEPTTPPTLVNTNAITNNTNLVIYVPTGTLSAYQSASNWSTFASKMVEL